MSWNPCEENKKYDINDVVKLLSDKLEHHKKFYCEHFDDLNEVGKARSGTRIIEIDSILKDVENMIEQNKL